MATQPHVHPAAAETAEHRALARLLEPADVSLDGKRPWDIVVHDARMPARVLAQGSLGAGESYMDGWWDCAQLDEMLARVLRSELDRRLHPAGALKLATLAALRNPQSLRRAFIVGRAHYDIGDDLFERMLDTRMIYSCAFWDRAGDLATAQEAKLDLVCRKLGLASGMRVLDIGCGWGGAAQFAAERYGVEVTGITVSKHQAEAAAARCSGLPVDIRLEDYRRHSASYDRIWSIGMFEHVGVRNYRAYLRKVRELLRPDGLFLLHTIGSNTSVRSTDPWIDKYIFPNSMLPSVAQIARAAERWWVIEDWHGFGPHYDHTLLAWYRNFEARWPEIAARYGERFRRMWRFWLLGSAASFRARRNQLWQFVLSPHGVPGGYRAVR
ncbi:MAG TPA: cyclopropane fatty acyl phospholipid synthase [Steroidobacteraceae bacterium]|nr:cyclopropane fatty acyl phospholipid synthase [Steroidobacteraceae bacterium]